VNGRTVIAIDLDGDRLGVVSCAVGSSKLTVTAWHRAKRPERIDPADAPAVGQWIAAELRQADIPKAGAVLAVHRGEVVLKRISLPRSDSGPPPDLAGMVRLQMARQMTVPMEGTAVDYVQIADDGRFGEDGESAGTSALTVLAGALPGDRYNWLKVAAEAGQLKISRIGLRASGAAAVLAEASRARSGPILGVVPGLATTEFVIVADGRLVFARAVETGLPDSMDDLDGYTEKIVVEARRTWMSYRVGRDSGEVEAVAVVAEGRIAEVVGRRCGEALEMAVERFRMPAAVELPSKLGEADRCLLAPLAGLLAEGLITQRTLDFANPRKAPDLAARKRQRMLLGVFGVIVVGGGLYVAASVELGRLAGRVEAAQERKADLEQKYNEFQLQDARLKHIRSWTEPRIDWLAHTRWLSQQLPDPHEAQLDELSGDMRAGVTFVTTDRSYDKGRFSNWQEARLVLTGKVGRRDVANEIRERLMASDAYRVDNQGPDVPERFDYALITEATDPAARPSAPKPAAVPAPSGGAP
jgi:Tfp pilus assembly PilM family ATPase